MAFFYSAETNAFFHDAIHDEAARPGDALLISDAVHDAIMQAQADGLCIRPGRDGLPVASEHPPLTEDQALAALRRQRDRLLRECDRTQIPDYPISDEARAAWAAYRRALRDLPETITDPAAVAWPSPPVE